MAMLFISPTGSGSRDGSSWENAGTLGDLPNLVKAAGPGGEVLLRADQGPYFTSRPIILAAGGVDGASVTIRGVDGAGQTMRAEIHGNRPDPWTGEGNAGTEVFRLLEGADNLTFQDLTFRNVGDGAFRIGSDIENLHIQQVDATNLHRFLQSWPSGSATTASVSGLIVEDVSVKGFSKSVIHLTGDSKDVLIEDVFGDSERQEGGNYIFGVQLADTTHDVTLRRVTMSNAQGDGGGYWNGDGFSIEGGTYNIRFEDTMASGNTDAGYDIKSENTVMIRAHAEGNSKNFRFWSDSNLLQDSVGLDPQYHGGSGGPAQIWLGEGAKAVVIDSRFSDDNPQTLIFDLSDPGALLTLQNTTVSKHPSAPLSSVADGSSIITMGEHAAPPDQPSVPMPVPLPPPAGGVTPPVSEEPSSEVPAPEPPVKGGEALAGGSDDEQDRGNGTIDEALGGNRMLGSGGNDTHWVDSTADVVSELSEGMDAGGQDLIVSTVTFSLSNTESVSGLVEHLSLAGDDPISGTGSSLGNKLAGNNSDNQLKGLDGDDVLKGHGGNDHIDGGSGNDVLIGSHGADQLFGGANSDLFCYNYIAHSPVGEHADLIHDFVQGEDLIAFDAKSLLGGDQEFVFIGTNGFSGGAGELRYENNGDTTSLFADINGDKVADMEIKLIGNHALDAKDLTW